MIQKGAPINKKKDPGQINGQKDLKNMSDAVSHKQAFIVKIEEYLEKFQIPNILWIVNGISLPHLVIAKGTDNTIIHSEIYLDSLARQLEEFSSLSVEQAIVFAQQEAPLLSQQVTIDDLIDFFKKEVSLLILKRGQNWQTEYKDAE